MTYLVLCSTCFGVRTVRRTLRLETGESFRRTWKRNRRRNNIFKTLTVLMRVRIIV